MKFKRYRCQAPTTPAMRIALAAVHISHCALCRSAIGGGGTVGFFTPKGQPSRITAYKLCRDCAIQMASAHDATERIERQYRADTGVNTGVNR